MRAEAGLGIPERNGGQKNVTEEVGADLIAQSNESGIQRNGSLFVHPHHFLDLLLIFLLQTDCGIQLKVRAWQRKQRDTNEITGGENRRKGSFA